MEMTLGDNIPSSWLHHRVGCRLSAVVDVMFDSLRMPFGSPPTTTES
jgi:hypothetical protein